MEVLAPPALAHPDLPCTPTLRPVMLLAPQTPVPTLPLLVRLGLGDAETEFVVSLSHWLSA